MYTVSQKNDTDVALYDFDADQPIFSERERDHVRYMLSPVRLSSVCLSVTFVRFAQPVAIFGNGHPLTSTENFMEIVLGEPLRRGVSKRGSQI